MNDLKDKKILFVTFIVLLLILSTGLSYAYFSTSVKGNENAKDVAVEMGTLKLVYTDSSEIVAEHIKLGWTTTKEVTVKNTGTLDTAYNLVWQELNNEIGRNDMVISYTCERLNSNGVVEGTCSNLEEKSVKIKNITKNISIESGITHKYIFTITFKETNQDQNYNQGKSFSGVLGIEEYKDTAIYCTFDGELTQGAEYVNGEYTYRYKQEGKHSSSGLAWSNISADGWGVQLTDKTSTEPVTSKICTYINDISVVSMRNMFSYSQATTLDLSSFDTRNVTDMSGMFYYSQTTTLDLSNFDTSNVTDMSGMFYYSQATTLDLSNFDTSNVTDMGLMFEESSATSINLSSFDTSKVTDMSEMFGSSQATTLDLSSFDTSKVTDMSNMFSYSQAATLDLSSFDTSNVTNMYYMFDDSQATTLDLSSFDTSKVTDMFSMFAYSTNLKTIYVSNKFNTNAVIDNVSMFAECTSLVGGSGTKYDSTKIDKTYARIDGGTTNPGYFTSK